LFDYSSFPDNFSGVATKFPLKLKRGSVTVTVARSVSRGYESFTLYYYQDGVRQHRIFSRFDDAEQEAETVAARLTSGEAGVIRLTSADSAAYSRAREILDPLGIPIESAAAAFAHEHRRLAAIAIPNFVKARQSSQRAACVANLKMIDGAKAMWALEQRKVQSDEPSEDELFGPGRQVKALPHCPVNGFYSINPVREKPTCSIPGAYIVTGWRAFTERF
jgi:hypothetical protein